MISLFQQNHMYKFSLINVFSKFNPLIYKVGDKLVFINSDFPTWGMMIMNSNLLS